MDKFLVDRVHLTETRRCPRLCKAHHWLIFLDNCTATAALLIRYHFLDHQLVPSVAQQTQPLR